MNTTTQPASNETGAVSQALYKISNAMRRLDVCRATIYRMAARGDLELVRISARATRVTAASVDRVISAGRETR